MKLIIVSNRLPFTLEKTGDGIKMRQSVGGVATGIHSFIASRIGNETSAYEVLWYGSPGQIGNSAEVLEVRNKLRHQKCYHPVFLPEELQQGFYTQCCNSSIYPLFTGFCQHVHFTETSWQCYRRVNKIYASQIVKEVEAGDVVWVNDYHFLLLPQYIRQLRKDISIGFFLHIPFPKVSELQHLPVTIQKEMLSGMLGADLIGFHIDKYRENFSSAITRLLNCPSDQNEVLYRNRISKLRSFPMGIDFDRYQHAVQKGNSHWGGELVTGAKKVIKTFLSVDRLDYTKGIANKLWAYEVLLERFPSWQCKVKMVMIVAPSRTDIPENCALKEEIDELVAKINDRYGTEEWQPIEYYYRQVEFPELTKFYAAADIALVTPIRDGMNLVAKEFVSSRIRNDGVLILSKEAGAREELGDALIADPFNISEMAVLMNNALNMQLSEQKTRTVRMQGKIKKYDVFDWVADILKQTISSKVKESNVQELDTASVNFIADKYRSAKKRILFLDYDGTLVPLQKDPASAVPDIPLLQIISDMAADSNTKVIIVSGRNAAFLEDCFNTVNIDYAAEYGSVLKKDKALALGGDLKTEWKTAARQIIGKMNLQSGDTFIEEKEFSMVLHFKRNSVTKIESYLSEFAGGFGSISEKYLLEVVRAKTSIEIKHAVVNKGRALRYWMEDKQYDFILAIGDDQNDESMFRALPPGAFTVRVGRTETNARYLAKDHQQVRSLLERLLKK